VPDWATARSVVGYTYVFALNADMIRSLLEGQYAGTPYPTVYYKRGHRTVKHNKAGNVGWEGTERRWLFFGNVHDEWLDTDYWKDRTHTHSKLNRRGKEAFAKQLRHAAAGQTQDQPYKKCTSYYDPNTRWASHRHQGEDVLAFNSARLLEIFYEGSELSSHPSRNRFRWAAMELKPLLHKLAVEGVQRVLK
jgi:hypothetical protein